MSLQAVIADLEAAQELIEGDLFWHTLPAQAARLGDWLAGLDARITPAGKSWG